MNKTELIETLKKRGVECDPSMTKAELEALLVDPENKSVADLAEAPEATEPVPAELVVDKLVEYIQVPKDDFSKLIFDLVHGYTKIWVDVGGKKKLMEMLGAKSREEVDSMYEQFKSHFIEKVRK